MDSFDRPSSYFYTLDSLHGLLWYKEAPDDSDTDNSQRIHHIHLHFSWNNHLWSLVFCMVWPVSYHLLSTVRRLTVSYILHPSRNTRHISSSALNVCINARMTHCHGHFLLLLQNLKHNDFCHNRYWQHKQRPAYAHLYGTIRCQDRWYWPSALSFPVLFPFLSVGPFRVPDDMFMTISPMMLISIVMILFNSSIFLSLLINLIGTS